MTAPRPAVRLELRDPDTAERAAAVLADAGVALSDDDNAMVVTDETDRPAGAGAPAVVVTDGADRRAVLRLIGTGVRGVVDRNQLESGLPALVGAINAGFVAVPAAAGAISRRPVLTARQQQIVSLVVLGLSNADIARRLFVTESTVKTHLRGVFDELGVRTRKEVIDLVLDPASEVGRGILPSGPADDTGSGYTSPTIRS